VPGAGMLRFENANLNSVPTTVIFVVACELFAA
jgi:hypothetical protein